MPRISAEARAAATYRAGGKPPAPPKALSDQARAIWQEIVKEKPVGWFDSGSLVLLRQYCETTVEARRFSVILAGEFDDLKTRIEAGKHLVRLNGNLTTLATKLRLTVQAAVNRHSRMLNERGPGDLADDPLLGGGVLWQGKLSPVE